MKTTPRQNEVLRQLLRHQDDGIPLNALRGTAALATVEGLERRGLAVRMVGHAFPTLEARLPRRANAR